MHVFIICIQHLVDRLRCFEAGHEQGDAAADPQHIQRQPEIRKAVYGAGQGRGQQQGGGQDKAGNAAQQLAQPTRPQILEHFIKRAL